MMHNIAYALVQLADTDPRKVGEQLQLLGAALEREPHLTQQKTVALHYNGRTAYTRFTPSDGVNHLMPEADHA